MSASDVFDAPDGPDDAVLAAEYALRLTDAEATLSARGREATDAGFAHEVALWNAWAAAMFDQVAPVEPSAAMWNRIVAAVWPGVAATQVVPLARKRRLFPAVALMALAASVALAVGVWTLRPDAVPVVSAAPARPLIASLAPAGAANAAGAADGAGAAALGSARYDVASRTLSLTPVALAARPARSFELWVVPADGLPCSLGVLAPNARLRIALADDLAALFASGATIAISAEAEGGSRSGQPAGPIVASGKLGRA